MVRVRRTVGLAALTFSFPYSEKMCAAGRMTATPAPGTKRAGLASAVPPGRPFPPHRRLDEHRPFPSNGSGGSEELRFPLAARICEGILMDEYTTLISLLVVVVLLVILIASRI
jgi:hypothetical protein